KPGPAVEGFTAGDEVIGFTDRRASHAEYVVVDAQNLAAKPANVSWEVAGSLAVAGSAAYASVHAVSLKPGERVAVSAAAGGVGLDRVNTSIDFEAARHYGVKAEGTDSVKSAALLAELAGLVASGGLEVPIAATFPLDDVRAAFELLERGHTRGKIVLLP